MRGIAVTRVSWAAIVLLTSLATAAKEPCERCVRNQDLPWSAAPSRIDSAVARAGDAVLGFSRDVQSRREVLQPYYIFVPGILGSELRDKDNEVFWGERSRGLGQHRFELAFDGTPAPNVRVLYNYKVADWESDVYGRFLERVETMSLAERGAHFLPFAYDWRDDLRNTAARFDAELRRHAAKLSGRDVVILAHSMGGLVVQWWYWKHYEPQRAAYPFLPRPRFAFLGTPHAGATSALYVLAEGYGADAPALEKKILNYVMRDLNEVSYTFYSVLQLLPFNHYNVVFRPKNGRETTNFRLLDTDIWRRCRYGEEFWKARGLTPDGFYETVLRPRLKAAAEFHKEMESYANKDLPDSVCFFSERAKTPRRLRIEEGNKRSRLGTLIKGGKTGCNARVTEKEPGDGRVPAEISFQHPQSHRHVSVQGAAKEHAELPNDVGFLNYLDDLYLTAYARAIVAATVDPKVYEAFRAKGALLPVSIDDGPVVTAESAKVLAFNRAVMKPNAAPGAADMTMAAELYKVANTALQEDEADRLYALAVLLAPRSETAVYAANRLAYHLVQNGRWAQAVAYLKFAENLAPHVRLHEPEVIKNIYRNLGKAYKSLGRYDEAETAYLRAEAKEDLESLRKARSTGHGRSR